MAKLYRPHIPLKVRVAVAERQAAEKPTMRWGFYLSVGWHPTMHYRRRLTMLMEVLAAQYGCLVRDLRLDHDPALGTRMKRTVGHPPRTIYSPDANDPAHLKYRPHGAEYADSHDVKTRIRGDHGQYSDITLIKRERRRNRKKEAEKSASQKSNSKPSKWRSRPMGKAGKTRWPKRSFGGKKSIT